LAKAPHSADDEKKRRMGISIGLKRLSIGWVGRDNCCSRSLIGRSALTVRPNAGGGRQTDQKKKAA